MQVTLPDGAVLELPAHATGLEAATRISEGLARAAVAVEVDGRLRDLTRPLPAGARVRIVTFQDAEGRDVFMHSAAHLLAQAVTDLFPAARPTIGPPVDEGFYYDFDHPPFTEEDLGRIEERMKELVAARLPLERVEMTRAEAREVFSSNPYKLEMIEALEDGAITAYRQGGFVDLCRGPHVPDTGRIKAVKVLKVAGAYWRGDASRQQLQRVYAIAFPDRKLLKAHLDMLEEAKKRDHRRLGRELDLFSFQDVGPGFPFWHDSGMRLRETIVAYWRSLHRREGYQEISTPIALDESLWHTSGHASYYRENMYFTHIDERAFAIKPMNCPGGLLVYKDRRRSYRELPLRIAELGLVHRHELSGVLHGLFRVRSFTQDDAHIYCTPGQLEDEVVGVVRLVLEIYRTFGFDEVKVELSTRPEKRIGADAVWDLAEATLEASLKRLGLAYTINAGDGAFYGPKIDFHIRDCMNRSWQCGTVQVDFSLPSEERFNLTYEGADGQRHQPVMVHRAILGSLERFIGILLEHHAGKLPLWLSPRQVRVIPVTDAFAPYAQEVARRLGAAGLLAAADCRNETVGRKVREAQLDRVNYQLVVGEREVEAGTVSVRTRGNEQLGTFPVEEFLARCLEEIRERRGARD
ncbi:MAG: threonine--tRNA ligase [Deltaproteobacteria bacterium]|nr:threonine--tRNA ligase [Deltaproteobacteria bacterium]